MVPSPYLKMYRPFLHYFNNNFRNFFFHRNIAVLFENRKTNALKLHISKTYCEKHGLTLIHVCTKINLWLVLSSINLGTFYYTNLISKYCFPLKILEMFKTQASFKTCIILSKDGSTTYIL